MTKTINAIILATLFVTMTQLVMAVPANDTWQSAEPMTATSGTRTGTTADATVQPCEPVHIFPDDDPMAPKKTVWYRWQAPFNGSYTFKVASSFQTSLSVYVLGTVPCGVNTIAMPVRITENRAFMDPTTPGSEAKVTFAATAGGVYYLAADGYGTTQGSFTLTWEKTKYRYNVQLDSRDRGTDLVITRPGPNSVTEWWFYRGNNVNGYQKFGAMQFGRSTDRKLMGDFNGDGLTDFAAVRPENGQLTWWIIDRDGNVLKVVPFGLASDRPIVGDYDGDGIADIAVTRNEGNLKTWYILRSSNGSYSSAQFGLSTDREMVGDYDGDGRTDLVVLRLNGNDYTWYMLLSSNNAVQWRNFGRFGDIPQAVDMNLDGVMDWVMFRANAPVDPVSTAGKWYFINTGSNGQTIVKDWGQTGDWPQVGDYDGDGFVDLAVFRSGTWWLARSGYGAIAVGFGQAGDRPMSDLGIGNAFLTF